MCCYSTARLSCGHEISKHFAGEPKLFCVGAWALRLASDIRTPEPGSQFTLHQPGLRTRLLFTLIVFWPNKGALSLCCLAHLSVALSHWASTNLESSTLFCLDHVICGESILLSTRHSKVIVWPSDPRTSVLGISITLPEGWNMYRCEHDSQAVLSSEPILL